MKNMIYQLVCTEAVTENTEEQYKTVYSILEIEKDSLETNFIYDVSRIKERAEEILREVRKSSDGQPIISVLENIL